MKRQRDIILILGTGFVLTILWVVFNVYHNNVTSTINEPLSVQIQDIPGQFDTETIDKLKSRQQTEGVFELEAITSPTPTPELIEEEIELEEEEIEPTPLASEGAQILE